MRRSTSMVFVSLTKGIRRTIASRAVLPPLFLCNLAIAVPLALTFHGMVSTAFGTSRASLALLGGYDSAIVTDLLRMHPTALPDFLQIVGGASLLYVILNTFLTGGVISALQYGEPRPGIYFFLVSCVRFFGRFLRLLLLTGSITVSLTTILLLLGGLLLAALARVATSETTILLGAAFAGGIVLITVLLLVMVADYAKVGIVLRDSASSTRAFRAALRFVLQNLGSTIGLQALLFSILLLLMLLLTLFWTSQQMDSAASLTATLLIHQVFILLRITVRVLSFGSESALLEALQKEGADGTPPLTA